MIILPDILFVIIRIENFDVEETAVCGIGPGLGTHEKTAKSLLNFLKSCSKPLILDADALNIIAQDPANLNLIPEKSIITPHPKEFERLFGKTENSFERIELAKQKAEEEKAAKEQYDVIYNAGAAVYAKPEFDLSEKVIQQVSKAN